MSKFYTEKLFLCNKCKREVNKNAASFLQVKKIENSDDYECDICGGFGDLYFCIAGYYEEEVKA